MAKQNEEPKAKMGKKMWIRWFISQYILPVKKNKIVFSQFGGKGYGCNPRAICDEFLRRDEGYDLVWILGKSQTREKAGIPDGVRTVTGDLSMSELATAKVWINNIHFNVLLEKGLKKRKKSDKINFNCSIEKKKKNDLSEYIPWWNYNQE